MRNWIVYLSGEVHTDWREVIKSGAEKAGLPVEFYAPVTDHDASDNCGVGEPAIRRRRSHCGMF